MADYIYRPNFYTPADHKAQIRSFERMARKGWQLDRYDSLLLRYKKDEPSETHYAMTFLRAQPIKGIETASKHRILDRAQAKGWTLVCDVQTQDLQILRTERLNPIPIEEDAQIARRQTAVFLRKQHLRQRIALLLLPLLVYFVFAAAGLSPLRMVAVPAYFWPYTLFGAVCLYSLLEVLWFLLWRLFQIPACTAFRGVLRAVLLPLYALSLYSICAANLRMIAFLLLALTVTVLAVLSYRLLKRRFYENRALAAPMFVLLITMLALFMADIVINLYIKDEGLLTLSATPAPVTFEDIGYNAEALGPYAVHSPAADYMIYGQLDPETDTYVYYEVCTISPDWLRTLVLRRTAWDYWMEPTAVDPALPVEAAYTTGPNFHGNPAVLVSSGDTIYSVHGLPKSAAERLLGLLLQ